MTRTRVFLVDNHAVLRQALRLLIGVQPDMEAVGESTGDHQVAASVVVAAAEVVIMDVSMPVAAGPRVTAAIRKAAPEVKIVALTRHAENAYVEQMLQAGATGYVLKQSGAERLLEAIRTVVSGGSYLDPTLSARGRSGSGRRHITNREAPTLSEREQEVATMVAYGHTNKEISSVLGITIKTVESHKSRIMEKLEITSRAELVRFAILQGWVGRAENEPG